MLTLADIAEQITDIYLNEEDWHNEKLTREEAVKYHTKLLQDKVITYRVSDGMVVGYMEVWKINAKQLNRIRRHEHFSALSEDVKRGTIGFLANVWIKKEFRHNEVADIFKDKFRQQTKNCNLIAGMRKNRDLRIHRNTGV